MRVRNLPIPYGDETGATMTDHYQNTLQSVIAEQRRSMMTIRMFAVNDAMTIEERRDILRRIVVMLDEMKKETEQLI